MKGSVIIPEALHDLQTSHFAAEDATVWMHRTPLGGMQKLIEVNCNSPNMKTDRLNKSAGLNISSI